MLIIVTIAFYFTMSSSLLYIPTTSLVALGFSFSNWWGILTYSFLHISPGHLLGNLILLFIVGVIAEQKLRLKDYFAIYFLSGSIAAIVFSTLVPETTLIGASAAISGLIAVAFIVDIKKALVGVFAFVVVLSILSPSLNSYTQNQYDYIISKEIELRENYSMILDELEYAKFTNDTEKVSELEVQKNQTFEELNTTYSHKTNIEHGMKREEKSHPSPLVHLFGALTGLVYIVLFRNDLINSFLDQIFPPPPKPLKIKPKRKLKKKAKKTRKTKRRRRKKRKS